MASPKDVDLNALYAVFEERANRINAEVVHVRQAMEILRRWLAAESPQESEQSEQKPPVQPKHRIAGESSVRDIVLEAVCGQTTFKLETLVNKLTAENKVSGSRRAIYGTITGVLRRNKHIFRKMRPGLYRVLQPSNEDLTHEPSHVENVERTTEEQSRPESESEAALH